MIETIIYNVWKFLLECSDAHGYDWKSCYRCCLCSTWKDEYCDGGRGVCMKVKVSFTQKGCY